MITATSTGKRTIALPGAEHGTPGRRTSGGFAGAVACEWTVAGWAAAAHVTGLYVLRRRDA
ncbi:hypothetical protein [Streptomyces yangpuensis]|uniref:hypothetical protein n=1 Tax=Streptomyces yangpuensis TaxID=1648182 RepID=UPI00364DE0DD